MKKILSIIFFSFISLSLFSQTIVPTTPSNKNVFIEEYTGTSCVNCPDGHRISAGIIAANPGRVFAINIHQGIYSGDNPDYKTQFGDALAQQYSIAAYPVATISRGANVNMNRTTWATETNQVLAQNSPVNVAATASIDWNTRIMNILVEVYYTGNAVQTTNKLNIALVQDNVLGPQVGTSAYPEMVHFGNLYQHNHMLRHLITGQWGDEIPSTTGGSFFSKTYEYQIPEHIRNVPLHLKDLSIYAFVCENNKTILSGNQAEVTFVNAPEKTLRFEKLTYNNVISCNGHSKIQLYIFNDCASNISNYELTYTDGFGEERSQSYSKPIASKTFDTISLPIVNIPLEQDVEINTHFSKIDELEFLGINQIIILKKTVPTGNPVLFRIATDRYASETTVKIFKPDGTILVEGGPWANLTSNGTTIRDFEIDAVDFGCYRFEVYDTKGDGINAGFGAGYFTIYDISGNQIFLHNGKFTNHAGIAVYKSGIGIHSIEEQNIKIYPNPVRDELRITNYDSIITKVEIYDVTGKQLSTFNYQLSTIDVSHLSKGIYFVKITTNRKIHTFKVVK